MSRKQTKRKSINKASNTKTKMLKQKNKIKITLTKHAYERMDERIITRKEVEEAVNNGVYILDGPKVFKVHYKNVRIVVKEVKNRRYDIITVMHDKKFEERLTQISKEENISLRQAAKRLKNINSYKDLHEAS